MRNFSGINFNYTYRLHLVPVFFAKFDLHNNTSSKNHGQIKIILKSSQFTGYAQYANKYYVHQMQQ